MAVGGWNWLQSSILCCTTPKPCVAFALIAHESPRLPILCMEDSNFSAKNQTN